MASVKIFSPGDWRDVPEEQFQLKIASAGLGPNDARDAEKLVSGQLLDRLKKMPLHDDCYYVHKVAMGGSHRYGPNRWGDGFREEVLERDHHTFELQAKAYRQHKSQGDHYGHVKVAGMRPEGFVELVTEYYGTPEAARRNGGRVADLEIESLSKRGYIPVSMGSMVPFDTCVVCGKEAPKPKDRCSSKAEGGDCPLFGCKTGMLKVAADGRMNFVDNPFNRFYDISMVGVGADPVANGVMLPLGAGEKYRSKLAEFAYSQCDKSQELSEHESLMVKLAYKWSELELSADSDDGELDPGYASAVYTGQTKLAELFSQNPQQRLDAMGRLAKEGRLPDFASFASASGAGELEIKRAEMFVPDLYSRLIVAKALLPVVKQAAFYRNSIQNSSRIFASSTFQGVDSHSVLRSTLLANASGLVPQRRKTASLEDPIPEVVAEYAAMKLAMVCGLETIDPQVLYGVVRRDLFKGIF